jgi:Icc-related predicted phosphoesterase
MSIGLTNGAVKQTVRLAAIGDLHFGRGSVGAYLPLFTQISDSADVLLVCGDLTDFGLPEEARLLVKDLHAALRIPMVAVLGNHDYESGQHDEIREIVCDAGVALLDGDSVELLGLGFAGIKGFAGGFGRGTLGHWGEPAVKAFVKTAIDEQLKLEAALARLRAQHHIAVMHYAPIRATVEGEPLEIYPYLGTSRLEEPLLRYPVDIIFHGHAHNGAPLGHTANGVPVYNVSLPLLRRIHPERPPFHIMEFPVEVNESSLVPSMD